MSLPALLGVTPESAATESPYVSVEPQRVDRWAKRLEEATGGSPHPGPLPFGSDFDELSRIEPQGRRPEGEGAETRRLRIGVCWRGDQRVVPLRGRSFPPEALLPLAQMPGVTLVNLQHGVDPPADLPIVTLPGLGPHEMKLEDVAAVMQRLHLVVTCDTSIAHLAGALGVRVWVALKHAACWRWMLERDDSPWYPTMRLFRQTKAGDWTGVFERMAAAMREATAI